MTNSESLCDELPNFCREMLGSKAFREAYGIRCAYVAGAMYKGIASARLVIAMGRAGLLGFLGTGGQALEKIEADIRDIQFALKPGEAYGMNLLHSPEAPALEEATVDLFLRHGIRFVEAAAYIQVTPALVRYRLSGIHLDECGRVCASNRLLAKISRPEIAEMFFRPAPEHIVQSLVASGALSQQQAELARRLPLASEVCVEADSGGHTDQGVAYVLFPAIRAMRDRLVKEFCYQTPISLGSAGGIGTPEAAAAAFVLGADFIMTGSINQCTVEAGTSDAVKDMLQQAEVQDTTYAPAGDMFEYGAKVQVLKRGLLFPMRANKLHELYIRHSSIEDIDPAVRSQIEQRFFRRTFEEVWEETRNYYANKRPHLLPASTDVEPKRKMALIFKWYFINSTRLALCGEVGQRADYQVQCGPALGAFNSWVRGSQLEDWRNRHVAEIGLLLMNQAAFFLSEYFKGILPGSLDAR